MTQIGNLSKINPKDASTVSSKVELSDEAKLGLTNHTTVVSFIGFLVENHLYLDAIKLLSQGLPVRESIWWAYICVSEVEKEKTNPDTRHALSIIETWVYQPEESNRRAAEEIAKKLEFKTPASWVAMAIFWSGGSIAPANNPEVLIPSHYVGKAIVGAMMLAAASANSEDLQENYKRYLLSGINIANGGNGEN